MTEPYAVRVTVRGDETDALGHLNQSVYLQYAEHARWSMLQDSGADPGELPAKGVGPVVLEQTIRYRREPRAGDETEVTSSFVWGEGKTYRIEQTIRKTDGTVAAEISVLCGLLDLKERRLMANPREVFASMTSGAGASGG